MYSVRCKDAKYSMFFRHNTDYSVFLNNKKKKIRLFSMMLLPLQYLSTVAVFLSLPSEPTFQRRYLKPPTGVASRVKVLGSHALHHHHARATIIRRAIELQRNSTFVDGRHHCNLAQARLGKGVCRNSLVNKESASLNMVA
jgi:hypothetical protein